MKITFLVLLVICSILWVYFSDSYRISREAKAAFDRQEYELSYELASESLKLDPYNRGAFKIQSQSRQRLNIENFLSKSKKNYESATLILKKQKITPNELLQLQWIYDDFNTDYSTLGFLNSPTDREKEEIDSYAKWFIELKKQIDNTKSIVKK